MSEDRFHDRVHAGRRLGARLRAAPPASLDAPREGPGPLVLGLPRGGVPVAAEVARALGLPLDALVVRKLGIPGHEEVAFGAIGRDVTVRDPDLLAMAGLSADAIAAVEARERAELARREGLYRAGRPPLALAGRTAILVDDGIATGATTRAACRVARAAGAARVVLAVPVAPREWLGTAEAVDIVALIAPERLVAVGLWYDAFPQTSDAEVLALLRAGAAGGTGTGAG